MKSLASKLSRVAKDLGVVVETKKESGENIAEKKDGKITVYLENLKQELNETDDLHLGFIPLDAKKELILYEVVAHELAHQLIDNKCIVRNELTPYNHTVVNLKNSLTDSQRITLAKNTTLLPMNIEYLAGVQDGQSGEADLVEIDEQFCDLAELMSSHEFCAHMLSQKLIYDCAQRSKNPNLSFKKTNYEALQKYCKSQGESFGALLEFIESKDFMHSVDQPVQR